MFYQTEQGIKKTLFTQKQKCSSHSRHDIVTFPLNEQYKSNIYSPSRIFSASLRLFSFGKAASVAYEDPLFITMILLPYAGTSKSIISNPHWFVSDKALAIFAACLVCMAANNCLVCHVNYESVRVFFLTWTTSYSKQSAGVTSLSHPTFYNTLRQYWVVGYQGSFLSHLEHLPSVLDISFSLMLYSLCGMCHHPYHWNLQYLYQCHRWCHFN